MDRWSKSPGATESASNTSAGSYVWRFSPPRWWSGLWQAVNLLSLPRKHYGPAVLTFRWTGRRKSEPSDLRNRSEHAPTYQPTSSQVFWRRPRSQRPRSAVRGRTHTHLQAKSTAEGDFTSTSVAIITLGYRARCTEPGCSNLGRVIMRHFDAGGRPMSNAEFCNALGREKIERDRAAGLRIYDDREPS